MHKYLKEDEWVIIEEDFNPDNHKRSESLFSLGNGHMGLRANFEEDYSGPSLKGTYIAGIYYPDKTRVGWWKNGYPEYFAKVLNAPDWIGFHIRFGESVLDLYKMKVQKFRRILNMKQGFLFREFEASWPDGRTVRVETTRFVSLVRKELGAIEYRLTPLNFSGLFQADLFISGNVVNEDANYDEKFWEPSALSVRDGYPMLRSKTKKSGFEVCFGLKTRLGLPQSGRDLSPEVVTGPDRISHHYSAESRQNEMVVFTKYAAVTTTRDYPADRIEHQAASVLQGIRDLDFKLLLDEHARAWDELWEQSDIAIEGDVSAQQGIRFNIFHLNQTYTGHDPRLNIGPKGFTGEKYGGSTYWDTEAYCLPFYLNTADRQVARNLLVYRYNHLEKAIENAKKLGFSTGAALYPMVTINGEECHNEWEITFEEIHRNGAIAYAIYNYIRHSGDEEYLAEYGLEVLIAISRFWAQRFTYSDPKQLFVMLGVTGPNEYENNVNNNWYTSYLATWTLAYTLECLDKVRQNHPEDYHRIIRKTGFNAPAESKRWDTLINHVYLPEDKTLGIFLQQEGYLDKEQLLASDLDPSERPINQHWSWDRILRSCFIKQADVLQGLYLFEDHFSKETIRRNFDFYEPRTVHESSLSPCIHAILAARIGYTDKAYEMYLRNSRLDLDDYNHEVHEGCHITSMAGTWLAIVEGFGGMKVSNDKLFFNPVLPAAWKSLSFTIHFRGHVLCVKISHGHIRINDRQNLPIQVHLGKKLYNVKKGQVLEVDLPG